jgi:hypothetical protein
MRVNKGEFLQVLESVQPGLTTRDVLEQSACFAFKDGHVYTFNDEVSCRRESPIKIEGAVQALPLLAVLRKMPEEEIDLEIEDGEFLVKGKRKKRVAGIQMQSEVKLAYDKVDMPEEWKKLPEDFSDAIWTAQQCVGKDESQYENTCVHLTRKFIEACDCLQAIRYKIKTPIEVPILVRGASIRHIHALGMTEMAETEQWIHFQNPSGLIVSCRRDVQDYESLDSILSQENAHPITLPKGLAEASDRAEIFSSENVDENEVVVELRPGKLRVMGQGVSGWYKEVKTIKYDGDPVEFLISPKLLIEITKQHNDCTISADKLRVDTGKFVYVAALGKIEENGKE